MDELKPTRRQFLASSAASLLLTSRRAEAFVMHAGFLKPTRDWFGMNNVNSIGARSLSQTVTIGSQIFMYGGQGPLTAYADTAAWFSPATQTWQVITPTSGTAPTGRTRFCLATNGTNQVFVWGGTNGSRLASGGLYTIAGVGLSGGTWIATSATNAPLAREYASVVYCNGKYIVWGGRSGSTYYGTGAIYDPTNDTWTPLSTTGAPTGRIFHVAVSTGTKMIIHGGTTTGAAAGFVGDTYVYDTATGLWSTGASTTAILQGAVGIWVGTRMYIWGGGTDVLQSYSPSSDAWTSHSSVNAPVGATSPLAAIEGTKLIFTSDFLQHGFYDIPTDTWTRPTAVNAPAGPRNLWITGYADHRLIFWGGVDGVRQDNGMMFYNPKVI